MDFTVNLGNQHFNVTTPVGNYFLLSGTPSAEAVLVNSTNFNSAVWQPYDGNVKMSLGPTDGVYQVWMGLKGSAPGSQPAWINRTVYLDRVPPTVVLTSPTNSTTSQPMIQIQGYAGEPLSQITLKNAAGVFTNQTGYGYVTNQFFDTNLLAFTTNYFQCYDVPLTNGVNSVTIYATDLAGNTTAVTTNYTLNLSNDHTPPVLSVIWPQSGTFISGQTFTLQAGMDDDTAKATATMTDSFGNTNTVQALVERSGLIWAPNLPMSAGTNTLKLTAVDAAGNVSTTNLTLIQSSVMVTMTPLAGSQFNQPYVTVCGTVNNTAAQVYVNGIQATVNANGIWSASSVPASPVGTAVFDVEVYGGTSQNVAGGGGVHANGLPGGTATGSDQFPNVQPATVGLMSYNGNQTYTISSSFVNSSWTDTIKWSYDVGGSYVYTPNPVPPNPINESLTPTEDGDAPIDPPWQFTQIPGLSGTINVATTRSAFTETWNWNNQTATKVMIEPTGQTTPGQSTLYYVQACASEVSQPPHGSNPQEIYDSPEPDYDLFDGNAPTWWYGDKPLPPQWLQIQNQTLINTGITNSDGSVWGGTYITEPVGMSVDVTPTATQVYHSQDYTFDVQAKPGLMLLDLNTGTNDTLQTNTVIVGQQINLLCRTVTANGPVLSNFQWTVPGNAI
jgi:hypothetical protein